MTETKTKKAFKDWDISDFDFAHATSLAHKPIRPGRPFNFFRTKKGEPCPKYVEHPTSNLAEVL